MINNKNAQINVPKNEVPQAAGVWYEVLFYPDVVKLSESLISELEAGYFIARNTRMVHSNGEFIHFTKESDFYQTRALAEDELMRRMGL